MTPDTADRLRAELLGIETSYVDADGVLRHAERDSLRMVVDALADGPVDDVPVVIHRGRPGEVVSVGTGSSAELRLDDGTTVAVETIPTAAGSVVALPPDVPVGFHELVVDDVDNTIPVVSTPATVGRHGSTSGIGVFAPVYTLWRSDAHDPCLTRLGELAEALAGDGVSTIATLPLYASFIDPDIEPFDPSPYAPVSRLHWNDVYVESAGRTPARVGSAPHLVDWADVGRRSSDALRAAAADLSPMTRDRLAAFVASRPDVADYARFRAAVERDGTATRGLDVDDVEPTAIDRHALGQMLMHEQLARLAHELRTRDQSLALDLPIGSHADGWETWSNPGWFATSMSVGAPPDPLFRGGQNWGFPPLHPSAGRSRGHEPWRRILTRAGEHADLLRVDHVMGVHRLWWIPAGADATDGVYVRYPARELMAVIATAAATTATTIVGENLGTVPPEVGALLDDWDVLGMFEDGFVMIDEDGVGPLPSVPARTVAGFRTHDMPAFAAAYRGEDLSRPEPPSDLELRLARRRRAVERYRHALAAELGRPVPDAPTEVLAAALERLGRSDAHLVMVDLDDLVGETEPHNVPGLADPVAWRRRMSVDLATAVTAESTRRLLAAVRAGRDDEPDGDDPGPDGTSPTDPIERI